MQTGSESECSAHEVFSRKFSILQRPYRSQVTKWPYAAQSPFFLLSHFLLVLSEETRGLICFPQATAAWTCLLRILLSHLCLPRFLSLSWGLNQKGGGRSLFVKYPPLLSSLRMTGPTSPWQRHFQPLLEVSSPNICRPASPVWGQELLGHIPILLTPLLVTWVNREANTPRHMATNYGLSEETQRVEHHRNEHLDSKTIPSAPLHPHWELLNNFRFTGGKNLWKEEGPYEAPPRYARPQAHSVSIKLL